MKSFFNTANLLGFCLVIGHLTGRAQAQKDSVSAVTQQSTAAKGLFESDNLLEITLSGNIQELITDRTSKDPQYYPIRLAYRAEDSSMVSIPRSEERRVG